LVKSNHQKIKASKIIADAAGKGIYHAKCIRSWAHDYVMTHQIPYSRRGHHAKTWSFLWDEDILLQIKSYVRENKWNITPHMIMLQMNEIILPGLGFAPPPTISLSTTKNYLKELGYIYERVKKDAYVDRHKREDVVAYQSIFLKRMSEFEHRMPIFSGDNIEVETWPDSNIKPLILVTHDECIFSAYNGSRSLWISYGEQPLRKKVEGRSIHVNKFLTDICSRLVLPDEMQPSNKFPREACVITYPGKNNDGWWKAEDLINQVTNHAISIFEARFPDYHIPKLCGEAKGLKEVLKERGLWPKEGLRLKEARELIRLQKTVPLALNSVLLPTIRQYARKAFCYMDAYQKGLNDKAAEFAVKKYHSHR
ncbi:12970_t:CDS:2, partial [Cetraspora pellucida]